MSETSGSAVFLSYASQDAAAVLRLAEALRAAGVEVWFDQDELVGGDAWDAKIRKQISACALFVPVISANTQARLEGYFRIEWKLAAQRTHAMATAKAFIVPVVLDATRDVDAHVPEEFKTVQWTRLRQTSGGLAPDEAKVAGFCARVRTLLGGGTVAIDEVRRPSSQTASETGHHAPRHAPVRWRTPVIVGLTLIAAAIAFVVLRLNRTPDESSRVEANGATRSPPVNKSAGPTTLTEAQKLVARARQIYESGDELSRENLLLAEEQVQRAIALDPSEPSAWEYAAWLSSLMVWHSIDESPARRETLLRQANRALALAPDTVSAQLAFATAQTSGIQSYTGSSGGRFAETESTLLRLADRDPKNWRVQRALGTTYRLMNRPEEAVRTLQRALDLSGESPMAAADLVNVLIRRRRYADAEAIIARALGRQSSARLLTFDVIVKCRWRGDTAAALKSVGTWPAWLLQEDRGLAVAWYAAYWNRAHAQALRLVADHPREDIRDTNFAGPRAVLSARAHEQAGNTVAARDDWRVVVQRCDRELTNYPQDIVALFWRAWALARLGDAKGAQAAATLVRQRSQAVVSKLFKVQPAATLWATVGWSDLALSELETLIAQPGDEYSLTRAYLELEPALDPLRSDPRFKALLAAAPAPAQNGK